MLMVIELFEPIFPPFKIVPMEIVESRLFGFLTPRFNAIIKKGVKEHIVFLDRFIERWVTETELTPLVIKVCLVFIVNIDEQMLTYANTLFIIFHLSHIGHQ